MTYRKSLYLDPISHDIVFTNGDVRMTSDGEITLQKIKTKLLFFLGDNFLNKNEGYDYFDNIFEKNVSDETIKNFFFTILQPIPEIDEILELEIERLNDISQVNVFFKVKDNNGKIIEGDI